MVAESKIDSKLPRFGGTYHLRYFIPTEIELLARQTVLIVERSEELMSGKAPTESTLGVCYVLREC